MKTLSLLTVLTVVLTGRLVAQAPAEALAKVISADERVLVFGQDSTTITAVLSQITELREELNFIIKDPNGNVNETHFPLKNDLIVTLYGQVGDSPQSRPFAIRPRPVEGSNRFRIELNVDLAKGLNRESLRRYTLECILMDRSLNEGVRDDQAIEVAPWLTTGMVERIAWRNGDADRGLYKALFKNGMMMDIEEMVALEDPYTLDAAERTAFRVTAGAFLMAMLGQDGGTETFLDYLDRAPTHEGDDFLLFRNTFFTAALTEEGLAKQWALQLANLTQDFVTETLSPLATEKALTEILQGTLEDEESGARVYRLIAYRDILALPEEQRRLLLSPMLERINLLSFRCFPSYRDLLSGYARITKQLAEGDDEDVEELLMILEQKRTALHQVGERLRDYLDWYQIANATSLTGEFKDYQRLKEELESKNPDHPGPLDHYLNAVQNLYEE
jgi:hypothetical protein